MCLRRSWISRHPSRRQSSWQWWRVPCSPFVFFQPWPLVCPLGEHPLQIPKVWHWTNYPPAVGGTPPPISPWLEVGNVGLWMKSCSHNHRFIQNTFTVPATCYYLKIHFIKTRLVSQWTQFGKSNFVSRLENTSSTGLPWLCLSHLSCILQIHNQRLQGDWRVRFQLLQMIWEASWLKDHHGFIGSAEAHPTAFRVGQNLIRFLSWWCFRTTIFGYIRFFKHTSCWTQMSWSKCMILQNCSKFFWRY